MANAYLRGESAQANILAFPTVATDVHARRVLRSSLTAAIAELVDLLDRLDGDPDSELNGDEQDGTAAEDEEGAEHRAWLERTGAGCPISDPGGRQHDGRELEDHD